MKKILKMLAIGGLIAATFTLPALAAEKVRIASNRAIDSQSMVAAQFFVDEVNRQFPGVIEAKMYPSGQLGKAKALIKQAQSGAIEMVAAGSGPLRLDKKLGIFDLPWLFRDWEHAKKALKGDFGKEVRELLEKKHNLVVLGVYGMAFRDLLNKERPITKPSDLNGLKIRVTGSKYRRAAFKEMGANPVPLSWSEVFTGLQQGVIDGVDATTAGFWEKKHHEVAGYLSLTNHIFTPTFLLASKAFMNKLTPKQQAGLRRIGVEITDKAFAAAAEINAKSLEKLKKTIKVNSVDTSGFAKKAAPVFDQFKSDIGEDWMKLVLSAK